jgi:hypothetical protein
MKNVRNPFCILLSYFKLGWYEDLKGMFAFLKFKHNLRKILEW